MADISYDKLCRIEFYNNVSAKDRVQDIKFNQLKIKVNHTYKKNEKITTYLEPSDKEDVINKDYLDTKRSKIEGHILFLEKDYNDYILHDIKQSIGEVLGKAVKTTTKIRYNKNLFDNYDIADEVLKNYLLIDEITDRRRPDLEELNSDNNVSQGFFS